MGEISCYMIEPDFVYPLCLGGGNVAGISIEFEFTLYWLHFVWTVNVLTLNLEIWHLSCGEILPRRYSPLIVTAVTGIKWLLCKQQILRPDGDSSRFPCEGQSMMVKLYVTLTSLLFIALRDLMYGYVGLKTVFVCCCSPFEKKHRGLLRNCFWYSFCKFHMFSLFFMRMKSNYLLRRGDNLRAAHLLENTALSRVFKRSIR